MFSSTSSLKCLERSLGFFQNMFDLGKVEVVPGRSAEYIEYVVAGSLEVARRVIAGRDEELQ